MKKKRLICIFPQGKNFHLVKDVGLLPYVLNQQGFYDVTISFYTDLKELPYLNNELQGLKYVQIKKIFNNENLNILIFLLKNIKNYQIVMFFHGGRGKLINTIPLKIFSLNKIKFYFKMDMNSLYINKKFKRKSLGFLFGRLLNSFVDLLTVESFKLNSYINEYSYYKTSYLPNGYLEESNDQSKLRKENLIITVGRLDADEKDIITFLKALENINFKNWSVKLIGPTGEAFHRKIKQFYINNPHLIDKVIFTGNISDRSNLKNEYTKAKVFVLTSIYEGFPLVFPEAISNGCYIVSSDLAPAYDITDNLKYGEVFPIGDYNALALILQKIIDDEEYLPSPIEIQDFAKNNFEWKIIAQKLHNLLQK